MMDRLTKKQLNDIHKVYHRFVKLFKNRDVHSTDDWNYYGYDFIERIEKWAKRYPNDVHIIRCDDGCHSTSYIVLIENKSDKFWFGITLIMIPQNSGIPCEMFFYDHSTDDMIRILTSIRNKNKKLSRD